ncbi:hypothetical protein H4R19_002699 [Coemansia spiralis]|nr:hypothetical protein H4R19_002699 [Coemansia spiralis]
MEDANGVLSLLIAHEAQVVTYRRLSRELKVHVNTAKQHLADYYRAHQDSCSATFLVCGTSSTGDLCMRLVAESELCAAQDEIDGARHHVYSVGPSMGVSRQAVVMANVVAGSIRANAEHGAVRSSVSLAPGVTDKPAAPAPAPDVSPPLLDVKPAVKHEEPVPASTPTPSSKGKPASKTAKSFFGRNVNGKRPPGTPQKAVAADTSPPPPPARSPSVESPKAKAEAVPAHGADDAADAARNRDIEDMFIDNSDFEDTPAAGAVKEETQATASDSLAEDTGCDTQDASDVEMGSAASDAASTDQPRARKRRKITKIQHIKNARGMLESVAVDEWESCSETEAETAAPQQSTPARTSAGGARKDGQAPASGSRKTTGKSKGAAPGRSILSFFGKK